MQAKRMQVFNFLHKKIEEKFEQNLIGSLNQDCAVVPPATDKYAADV
jgi:hypothetical protein